ncbi:xanthine dehydrogenase family protein molybdopterin-binding subunit [Paracraurococcus ruber]|uniref:Aldehyde oxidase/xanthine dehydrogenase a/b hammerhead domain-containing protein n=1 Tax=Paracraurococcus ruber TaxID=77675 RepID=A0ABS1CQU4_9PROT|nr:xanthine dehydrogenase family protein molybdopterin-binding subunit [Paracraurococcus ruber]MBK1656805.1 hypothetical protein [Paracraurococcus ruber]TDG29783.1 xanthine dehydrogenase family protein molybdopterin-binding subunit [Paracraurococcus ruber]
MARSGIGGTPRRREDARFLTGQGRYLDDLAVPGVTEAVLLRSPHAHAVIERIDTAAARAAPGVLAVLTAAEARADGLRPMHPTAAANAQTGEAFAFLPQPLLAEGRVRHVGEPVALVVAETRAQALDAAELIAVDYAALPAVTTAAAARAPDAPQIAAGVPRNTCMDWRWGDHAAADAAFARAAHRIRIALHNHRIASNPLEPRGVLGAWDDAVGRYVVHLSSQNVHGNRDQAARALGVPPDAMRFVAPDVGGGFGAKNFLYAEYALIPWAARRLGRPVRWIATRTELFLSDHQARDHAAVAELALDAEGRFLALRVESDANLGAYLIGGTGGVHTSQYVHLQGTAYAIPVVALTTRMVLTNTVPLGVTRCPGFAEAMNLLERLIDQAARDCGFDRADLRRRNLVAATPMTNALGFTVDSGDFRACLDRALEAADLPGFPERRAGSAARGRLRGLGFALHLKGTAGSPEENAEIRFEADGGIALLVGTQTIGQGHETTFPQILAERLGVPEALIRLHHGDTDLVPIGGGHGSSRATYMGGTAIWRAADGVIARGRAVAAAHLAVPEAAARFEDGIFAAPGTNRTLGLMEAAALAREAGAPLDSYHRWTREHLTYPNGVHVVEVEVDPETGTTALVRHLAVEDYGVLVNPMVATGQAHGAIAQGAGQALLEHAAYDPESGQPLAASFLDYPLPRAADLPDFAVGFSPTRCTTNPLGVKGAGEAAMGGIVPAIGNAIQDALAPLGVTTFDGPATPGRVWQAIRAARTAR